MMAITMYVQSMRFGVIEVFLIRNIYPFLSSLKNVEMLYSDCL